MTLQQFLEAYGGGKSDNSSGQMNWDNPAQVQAAEQKYNQLRQMASGTAGFIAPTTASQWGMGGGRGSLMSLDEYGRMIQTNQGEDAQLTQWTPEQLQARADFEAKYPGYFQLNPDWHLNYTDQGLALKGAGAGVGQYIEDPSKVQYDPTYGYISPLGNDASAGEKGGNGDMYRAAGLMAALAAGGYYGLGDAAAGGFTDAASGAIGAGDLGTTIGSEFSLAGGTAGNAAGGLYSGAGGVTGLTPAGAGVTGLTGSGSAGSLLSPAMAASAGLPASAAMGGSGLSAAEAMGGAANASWGVNQGGSALSRILGGNGSGSDALQIGGNLLGAGLGAYGANQQAQSYENIANKFMDMGQPYRNLLQQSYSPNFSMANQPDFMNALDIGSQAAARATSAKSGNPTGNPGAYADMQKYISGSLALPQLNTYRSQLGTFGQLGTDQSGSAMGAQTKAQGGVYDALGYGIGQATQPDNPLKGLFDQMKTQFSNGRYFT